jgi:hypothetical protein
VKCPGPTRHFFGQSSKDTKTKARQDRSFKAPARAPDRRETSVVTRATMGASPEHRRRQWHRRIAPAGAIFTLGNNQMSANGSNGSFTLGGSGLQ